MKDKSKLTKQGSHSKHWLIINRAYMAKNPETGCTYSMPEEASMLAVLVSRWKESGQQSFLDVALQYCDDKDLPVLKELRKYLAEGAKLRNPYQSTKARKEGSKDRAFLLMVQLIHAGATLAEAAGKAAAWLNDLGVEYRASTLEAQYTSTMRSGPEPLEGVYRDAWREMQDEAGRQAFRKQRELLRGPTDEELGNRRQ